jgi:hypothetical protein
LRRPTGDTGHGTLTISQSSDGYDGNTTISYNDLMTGSLSQSSAANFERGEIHKFTLFSTGSGTALGAGSSSAAGNLLAAITSSNGHVNAFLNSSAELAVTSVIYLTQSIAGARGNTSITYNSLMTGSLSNISSSFVGGKNLENLIITSQETILEESGSYIAPYSTSLSVIPTETGSYIAPYSTSLSAIAKVVTGSYLKPTSGSTVTYIRDKNTETFINVNNLWGTSSSDMHFINYHITGAYGNHNVDHIEPRYHFYSVGDVEIYSGSAESASYTDFTNASRFHNRQQITDFGNSNTQYESYITKNSDGGPGLQTGRAMGKTRYFSTSSTGIITLPSNHVRKFSNPWVDRMYAGSQNIKPGFIQQTGQKYEDLSSASFYRVKVTGGEKELRVVSGKSKRDNDDKIIY